MRLRHPKIILLISTGLILLALAFVAIVQNRGERRLASATTRFERTFGALDTRAHAPADLPDDENAAVAIQQGTALLALAETDKTDLDDFLDQPPLEPSPALRDLLARHAEALGHYRRAGMLDASSFGIDYSAETQAPLPPILMNLLLGKKLLLADARASLVAGDMERVLADSSGLASLRRALAGEPMVVFQLIAMSVEIAHHQLIQDVLSSELGTVTVLESLADQLDNDLSIGSNTQALQAAFAVEAASMLKVIDAEAIKPRAWWAKLGQIPERLASPFEEATFIDFYYGLAKAAEVPATQIHDVLEKNSPTTPMAGIIAQSLIPNLISCLERSRASAASRMAANLALAVRLHGLRHGTYPDDLGDFPRATAPEPYANGAIVLTRHPDGTATLSLPDAVALWHDAFAYMNRPGPRFTWHLPTSGQPTARESEVR